MLEHGVYTRLLDVYYIREAGIPSEQAARLIGARSKEEREAMTAVLNEFFRVENGIWVQKRCDEEIARLADKRRKASASANARWSHTERNANALPTHSDGNALQSPVTSKESRSARKPRKAKPAKHPIPENFGLSPELQAYVERYLPTADPEECVATFRSNAKAKGWEYADWNAHFQTIVRQWAPNSGHWSSGQYPRRQINGGIHAGVRMT